MGEKSGPNVGPDPTGRDPGARPAGRGSQRLRRAVYAGIAVFALLMVAASLAYPGGSWANPHADGPAFCSTFWCDLLRDPALSGRPNATSAALATAAMGVFSASLIAFWWATARALEPQRLATWIRASGSSGAIGLLLVTLLPSDRFGALHGVAVVLAGPCGITAAALVLVALLRSPGRSRLVMTLGALLLLSALLNLVQYARQAFAGAADAVWLPATQKIATLVLLSWMLAVTHWATRPTS